MQYPSSLDASEIAMLRGLQVHRWHMSGIDNNEVCLIDSSGSQSGP